MPLLIAGVCSAFGKGTIILTAAEDQTSDAIRQFLGFLGDPPSDSEERLVALERQLDRLAWVRHLDTGFDDRDLPEPPERIYAEDRAFLAARFPELGPYHAASNTLIEEGEAEVVVADALDDLVDIFADMKEILWRWENNSRADALFHLRISSWHWVRHLRGLQQYLAAQWPWRS